MKKVGCAWWKNSKRGDKYLSAVIKINNQDYNIIILPNKKKTNTKSPNYLIYMFDDEGNQNEKENTETLSF